MPIAVALAAATPAAQGPALDPALLTRPPIDAWPTYHGDYSGRRYSTLKQITAGNVKNLGLAWVYRLNLGRGGAIVGGEGPDTPPPTGGPPAVKSTPLMLNGILYFSVPDHVYAVDARTGREVWHYAWKTRGGDHIGNRGVGIHGGWLYFLTPDNYFVSLDLATGKERWHHEIANMKREYFSTNAPMIIGRHVIIGVGGDALDIPGYLESRDPENGNLIWRWNTTPKPGEPDAATWPNEYAMSNGGGMPWLPGTFDPELNLYYLGTGNPNPVLTGRSREGDNLYTCSIVALNPDTGKMVWYYQVTPHDTHDWDATQTPVLIDGVFDGRLQAVRREQLLYSITGAIHSGARFRQRPVKIGKCLADGVGQFRIREPRYVVKVDRKTRRFLDVVSHKHAAAACQKIEIYFCE